MKIPINTIFYYRDRIAEIYGTIIALGLIFYFFSLYLIGLVHIIELRLLNLPIMMAGLYYALKQYRRTHDSKLDYFRGLTLGIATSFIGTSTFTLFLFLLFKIDTGLLQRILENEPMGEYLNAYLATFVVWIEGIFSGFFVTFLLTNYMDTE